MVGITVAVEDVTLQVDGNDVAAWAGWERPAGPRGAHREPDALRRAAVEYVEAHPRPARGGLGGTGIAGAQRMELLRRLAAGPATREELLVAMRRAGWVGAADLENRLRDLRAADTRAGAARSRVEVVREGTRYRLVEPFPALDEPQRRALAFARAVLERLGGPLPAQAVAALDGLVPDMGWQPATRLAARFRASAAALERFDDAMVRGRAVRVRYFSMNSGRERTYELAPVQYVPLGPVVKAVCVPVDAEGHRVGIDKQFAIDRLIEVSELPNWKAPAPPVLALQQSGIALEVADGLYQVMRQRNLFGISAGEPDQIDIDVWRVRGTFPRALAWDVMEQLCAWAGSVQVHEPLWLVNAVCRRLRAGLQVMETGEDFRLVKPETSRAFASLGDAVHDDQPAPGEVELARPGLAARRLRPMR